MIRLVRRLGKKAVLVGLGILVFIAVLLLWSNYHAHAAQTCRSAITGRIVSPIYARLNPRTTICAARRKQVPLPRDRPREQRGCAPEYMCMTPGGAGNASWCCE